MATALDVSQTAVEGGAYSQFEAEALACGDRAYLIGRNSLECESFGHSTSFTCSSREVEDRDTSDSSQIFLGMTSLGRESALRYRRVGPSTIPVIHLKQRPSARGPRG